MDEVRKLYEETDLTLQNIALETNISDSTLYRYISENYSIEYRRNRKKKCYRNSKLGSKNPMTGKTRELHPRYKGIVSDNKGYLMVLKPEWYTGRVNSKHVFYHSVVMCEALGLTEIPKGFCIHHVDSDPYNNDISNLCLLSTSAHSKLHSRERASTIPKGSRGQAPSKRGKSVGSTNNATD